MVAELLLFGAVVVVLWCDDLSNLGITRIPTIPVPCPSIPYMIQMGSSISSFMGILQLLVLRSRVNHCLLVRFSLRTIPLKQALSSILSTDINSIIRIPNLNLLYLKLLNRRPTLDTCIPTVGSSKCWITAVASSHRPRLSCYLLNLWPPWVAFFNG